MRPDAHDRLVYAASKYLRCVVGCVTIRTSRRRSRLSANSIKSCCAPIEMPHERGARAVIKMRLAQLSFGDGLIANEVEDLREKWMTHADEVLEDEQLVATVYEALAKRRPKSRSRGRQATPAEVVLRLMILKHVRNWSYYILEREVRALRATATLARFMPRLLATARPHRLSAEKRIVRDNREFAAS